jgi:hypothetical protein
VKACPWNELFCSLQVAWLDSRAWICLEMIMDAAQEPKRDKTLSSEDIDYEISVFSDSVPQEGI